MAYQSLHASPIEAACSDRIVELPVESTIRRFDRPCVYSWYTMSASSPPLEGRNGSPPFAKRSNGNLLRWNRYICIVGDCPSGGVAMFALSMWLVSGETMKGGLPAAARFSEVFAPSSFCASTGSVAWNAPFAAVNEIGALPSQSWKLLTKKKTWVPFCWRLVSLVFPAVVDVFGFHVHVKG